MRLLIKLFVILLSLVGLVGCESSLNLGPAPKQNFIKEAPAKRQRDLSRVKKFRAVGAFKVSSEMGAGSRILNFSWYNQSVKFYIMRLMSPGALYTTTLRNFYGTYTFWHGPTRFARVPGKSFQNLMLSELGWSLPVNNLTYWFRAMPAPQAKNAPKIVTKYDKYGHLIVLGQDGWVVEYSRFVTKNFDDFPTKIKIWGRRVKFDIAIKAWTLYFDEELMDIQKTNKILLDTVETDL